MKSNYNLLRTRDLNFTNNLAKTVKKKSKKYNRLLKFTFIVE